MGRILVVADQGDTCCAIPRGMELAAKLGFEVEVVAFIYTPLDAVARGSDEKKRLRERLLAERRKVVQPLIDAQRRPGQAAGLEVVWEKHIDRWINRRCKAKRYDFVVKTGNRTESLVHTSTDWQLLRECRAPVLLVARKKWHRTRPVLVTLDLASGVKAKQALNSKVLAQGRDLARALEVELRILTAVEVPVLLADLDLVDPIAYFKQAQQDIQPLISKLAAAHDIPESAFLCKRGPVDKVITSHAAQVRAQIVVMGTVARKGVKARLLGNTAEQVLRRLKTDVLAIKP